MLIVCTYNNHQKKRKRSMKFQSQRYKKQNLKNKKIRDFVLMHIVPKVDIIIEGFRPGVMERFGLAPSSVHRVNPKVIYVRISGYG